MSISIQTNVNSVVAQENLRVTNEFQSKTIERLTSGYRINSSGDDAAGLAVANKFRSDIAELAQGVRNANDGLSQLQIVDSGLNNVSKILDRLKTLATQSASSTFTGDRTILNNEYQSLLTEINRQAANIGLGSGTEAAASRNNKAISVYIGGGSAQANSQIGIDLSATTDRVNSTSLGVDVTNVGGTGLQVTIGAVDLSAATAILTASSQTFNIATTTGTVSVAVAGGSAGILGSDVITQLNNGVLGMGITFSANATTGYLQAVSTNSFAVSADASVGAGTAANATLTAANSILNTAKYNIDLGTTLGIYTAAITLTITPAGGSAIAVVLSAGSTLEPIITSLKSQLAGSGVDVVRLTDATTTEIMLQSSADFTIVRGADLNTTGFGGLASGATGTVTDMVAGSDATSDALTALAAIATAVSRLGTLQGKVGTGQNKLAYSIQLAQSQLSGYAAAESRIRDADVAVEAANLTKVQVLTQASIAAMAQANSAPQQVLALLRG
ncbi:MAG: flagellin [Bryobacterales bacterium]|nr:flagellin [Bryobacterales bacterium]